LEGELPEILSTMNPDLGVEVARVRPHNVSHSPL
jgi:hypothetical protein